MIDHLSYSSISGYLQCARHWRYRYIDRQPSPSSDALLFGSAWHKMIALVASGQGHLGKSTMSSLNAWHTVMTTMEELQDNPIADGIQELGERLLDVPVIRATIQGLHPAHLEYEIELHVPGLPVPVAGFIDMIDADGMAWDFKTAGKKWTQDQADASLQPTVYLAALQQSGLVSLPAPFRYMIFTKTKSPDVQVLDTVRTAADVLAFYELAREVWRAIEAGIYVPNGIGSWKCSANYCEFWQLCEGGKR